MIACKLTRYAACAFAWVVSRDALPLADANK
jgi:hypothetical protein